MSQQVVDLVSALAWPAVVLILLVAYRRTLPDLLAGVLGRTTRLSVFQVGIELAPAPESYARGFVADVVESGRAIYQESGISGVLQEIAKEGRSDYALIELGSGNRWLTSRLFLFAVVLERMRGLRCLVFVARGSHLGLAAPAAVRWTLAQSYPWLEDAYAAAYGELAMRRIRSTDGALEPVDAQDLIGRFMERIQPTPENLPLPAGKQPPKPVGAGWVYLERLQRWERAEWIEPDRLGAVLHGALETEPVQASADVSRRERAAAVLRSSGAFVALVDGKRRFKTLADRTAMLERLAAEKAEERP